MLVEEVAHNCYLNSFREVKREPLTCRIWPHEVREAMGGRSAAVAAAIGREGEGKRDLCLRVEFVGKRFHMLASPLNVYIYLRWKR